VDLFIADVGQTDNFYTNQDNGDNSTNILVLYLNFMKIPEEAKLSLRKNASNKQRTVAESIHPLLIVLKQVSIILTENVCCRNGIACLPSTGSRDL
jgi:hypothetical protein